MGDTALHVLERLTNFYYSPTQRSVSDTLSSLFWWIFSFFIPSKDQKVPGFLVGIVIGYIIIFFGSLLYNELIVLHFCGFSKNTKYEVMERGDIESENYDSAD